MNRFSQLFSLVPQQLQPKPVEVGLDMGSSTTRVRVGNSLRYQQPSCAIVHTNTGEIVSFGHKAARHQSGLHRQTTFRAPIRKGAITDVTFVAEYLDLVLNQAVSKPTMATQIKGSLIVPTDVSKVEKYIIDKTVSLLGKGRWKIVRKDQIWSKVLEQPSFSELAGIIDLGGDTTEVVVRGDQGVLAKTIYLGGRQLVKRILQVIRSEHGFQLSWKSGEDIVHEIDISGLQAARTRQIVVRGKNMSTNKPDTVTLDGSNIYAEVAHFYEELTDTIFLFLGTLPAEVLTRTLETGVYFSGGLSQVAGTADYFQQSLDTSVALSDVPSEELVKYLFLP